MQTAAYPIQAGASSFRLSATRTFTLTPRFRIGRITPNHPKGSLPCSAESAIYLRLVRKQLLTTKPFAIGCGCSLRWKDWCCRHFQYTRKPKAVGQYTHHFHERR